MIASTPTGIAARCRFTTSAADILLSSDSGFLSRAWLSKRGSHLRHHSEHGLLSKAPFVLINDSLNSPLHIWRHQVQEFDYKTVLPDERAVRRSPLAGCVPCC